MARQDDANNALKTEQEQVREKVELEPGIRGEASLGVGRLVFPCSRRTSHLSRMPTMPYLSRNSDKSKLPYKPRLRWHVQAQKSPITTTAGVSMSM